MWREDDFCDAVISLIMFVAGTVLSVLNPCGFSPLVRYILVGTFSLLSAVSIIQLLKEFFGNK